MSRGKSQNKKHNKRNYIILGVVILLVAYIITINLLPIKPVSAINIPNLVSTTGKLNVVWPDSAESSVGVLGFGSLVSNGAQIPTPTASIAKVVTALSVLNKYPLELGQQGPTITLTQADVDNYNMYVAEDGSVVKVAAGEQITEYQALQAMLLPSANNMADTLAIWAFGSVQSYVSFANPYAKTLGMSNTTISDASGYSPSTVSTSNDLVKLGEAALYNPVIAQIVAQHTANLPVAGVVTNVDWFLGQDELIGIKTGNTDQAGGCFLSAAKYDLGGGNSITVIGAVMKASTLQSALDQTIPMLQSVKSQLSLKTLPANTAVATYKLPWSNNVNAITKNALQAPYLPELPVTYSINNLSVKPYLSAGSTTGIVKFAVGSDNYSTTTILSGNITKPSIVWKIFHPNYII